MFKTRRPRPALLMLAMLGLCNFSHLQAQSQLEITEVMFDSKSAEPKWEWFELRNVGVSDVNLDGAIFDDLAGDDPQVAANIVNIATGGMSANTVVPAGGIAVVYNGSALGFDDSRFRSAWDLLDTAPLIGVARPPHLNNSGDAFGIWRTLNQYEMDLANTDEDTSLEVFSFDHALVSMDFSSDFPSRSGASIQWNGLGDIEVGDNWFASEETTSSISRETFLADMQINNVSDLGNPGTFNANDRADGVLITEVMYNPASGEPEWEWLELFNATDEEIDFAATPYYLDDLAGPPLREPNLVTGSIPAGGLAILHHDSLAAAEMQNAWGDNNYIPVDAWPALNNGGDTIGLWSEADEYALDSVSGSDRSFDGALTSVAYLDGNEDWPNVANGESIHLVDLAGNPNVGTSWVASSDGDGTSRFASPAISSQLDHAGGDLGTPGRFFPHDPTDVEAFDFNADGNVDVGDADAICAAVALGDGAEFDLDGNSVVDKQDLNVFLLGVQAIPGDIDLDGEVLFADFLLLSNAFGQAANYSAGDVDCDGTVQFGDFLVLSANFGRTSEELASVPEPSTSALYCLTLTVVLLTDRRGRATQKARRLGVGKLL